VSLAIASGWWIGWAIGLLVVLLAASLLLAIIALARRITRQADDITRALDGARANTDGLFDVTRTNLAVDRITRGLAAVRTGGDGAGRPEDAARSGRMGSLRRVWDRRAE
jgi:hypothetical protein